MCQVLKTLFAIQPALLKKSVKYEIIKMCLVEAMSYFNDINLKKWKEEDDIWTDSLWFISERDKSGKHSGYYHGNFVPQIPYQLLRRYTKKGENVLDPFIGSGTTVFEAEKLNRNIIGIDIRKDLIRDIRKQISSNSFAQIFAGDSTLHSTFSEIKKRTGRKVHFVILHPPYADIIKFSNDKKDLSNAKSLQDFLTQFSKVVENSLFLLEKGRHLAVVIGDKYTKGQWVPLGFYCMNEIQKQGATLKSIIVKNMTGNREKNNKEAIWRYRALSSDYYIFKHEYILIFKK